MGNELAAANVNRAYSLSATNIAVLSFLLFFLYPRLESGAINPLLFQFTLVMLGVATFSLVFASIYYYRCSLGGQTDEPDMALQARRADRLWLLGYTVMFFVPSLVLFLIGLLAVASVWLALWLVYLIFVIRCFPKMQTPRAAR